MKRFEAVVFDWAGTMVDFGSFAPMGAFVEAFGEFGIEITTAQAREPMGMAKRDHIKTILEMPDISEKFKSVFGNHPGEQDIDRIYAVFVPMNERVAGRYADLVPGSLEMISYLRSRNIKIGSTTGYTRSIMEYVLPVAAAQGYAPDNLVCSDDVKNGRPAPDAMKRCFVELGIKNPARVIKVDDTEPGIGEGKAAGCICVGVTLSGNFAAKTPDELDQMQDDELNSIRLRAASKLKAAGADYIIDTVCDLPALIENLEQDCQTD
ncbi:MAG: phosphonoacetaldehyde hydrolase [Pseudomonadota bacterium]